MKLLLADKVIDAKAYNESNKEKTWEQCALRRYLNNALYNSIFNATEKSLVKNSMIENADNLIYGTPGGNNTIDKLFLLSIEDVCAVDDGIIYTDSSALRHGFIENRTWDEARMSQASVYAKATGGFNCFYDGVYWYLRTPQSSPKYVKDTFAAKGKQPYFTITLKGKIDATVKTIFKDAQFEFDINPCDLGMLALTPVIKATKNGTKIAKLTYTNIAGKKVSLKFAKNGKGDYSIVAEDDTTITIKGLGNYTGIAVLNK